MSLSDKIGGNISDTFLKLHPVFCNIFTDVAPVCLRLIKVRSNGFNLMYGFNTGN